MADTKNTSKVFNQYTKKYSRIGEVAKVDSNFFQGTWDFHQNNLVQYDPFINGYAFIYWTKLPDFLTHTSSLGGTVNDREAFKWMTMRNFKALDGLSDIELTAEAITAGFTGNEMNAATNITKGNTEFTLKHQELAGSPIRKLYSAWVNGIRDMDTGIATFNGYTTSNGFGYSMQNYTGELLYFVTDPSGGTLENSIEFAAYFTNVFPTRVPLSHLNYASGEHSFAEIDIPFKGIMHTSDKIDKLVVDNLDKLVKFRQASEYDPAITFDEDGAGTTGSTAPDYSESIIKGYKASSK